MIVTMEQEQNLQAIEEKKRLERNKKFDEASRARMIIQRNDLSEIMERVEYLNHQKEQRRKEENRINELEKLQDEYIQWMIDHRTTDPQWNSIVEKYNNINIKIQTLLHPTSSFSGLSEISTISIKNGYIN